VLLSGEGLQQRGALAAVERRCDGGKGRLGAVAAEEGREGAV
jgi:hypothetical protein